MARLAESTSLCLNGATVLLRPSLQAALRLAREHVTFEPVLTGICAGSISIITRVIGECSPHPIALADLFTSPGRSLASRIAELQPIALDLFSGLLGIDPDAKPQTATPDAKPIDLVEDLESLFGFATGILKWTPTEAWAATPREIMAAASFRQKAFAPADKTPDLDREAILFAANLRARAKSTPDAS